MRTAFLPGAGLGTRLLPLTEQLPKPLIPVFNKPLVEYQLDHLIARGWERFIINTHHQPGCWRQQFGGDGFEAAYRGHPVHFRHEPVLLETGGGLKNVEDLAGGEDLLLCNADTLHDFDVQRLAEVHRREGNFVTMGLRSSGGPLHVQWEPQSGRVLDIRNTLGVRDGSSFLFTGVYMVSPEIYSWIEPGAIVSVIPVFLSLLRAGKKIGGVLLDDGLWLDLGTPESYLSAHSKLHEQHYELAFPLRKPLEPVSPTAGVNKDSLSGFVALGDGCQVDAGAMIHNSIIWSGARIPAGTQLNACIVRSGVSVPAGLHAGVTF